MKRIVNYKTFINESSNAGTLNEEQIDFLNKYVSGKWHLNDDGFVDVDGDFDCFSRGVSDFKGIKFGKVTMHFNCAFSNLTSLEGCPEEVGGSFYCHRNNLTSLEFSPKEVGSSFNCYGNKLSSLDGAPKEVSGNFDCTNNKLTSLEGAPKEVGGNFNCSFNSLTSLEGGPEKVDGGFYCKFNNLTSLKGSPKEVGFDFDCSNNNLASLEGAPKEVGRGFYFNHNEGVSSETLKSIFTKMLKSKLEYSDALKSLWKEIPIDDKILLYSPDLDWFDPEEASILAKIKRYLKRYNDIKKMI